MFIIIFTLINKTKKIEGINLSNTEGLEPLFKNKQEHDEFVNRHNKSKVTKKDIKNILLAGSLDQLKDCLDFAPLGVIELVKSLAVELKINDLAKRQYILEKTGFNVTNAIIVNEETNKNDTSSSEESHRRAAPINQAPVTSQQRRSPAPQTYKVVSIDSEKE